MNEVVRNAESATITTLPMDVRLQAERFLRANLPGNFEIKSGETTKLLGTPEMEALMLERGPFFFIDRAVAIADESGSVKTVFGIAEMTAERVAGHFPGRPIVPLIELCKSIAQTGIILAAFQGDQTKAPIAISAGKSKATAKDLIDAPATILVKVTLSQARMRLYIVQGETFLVEGNGNTREIGRLEDIMYVLLGRDDLLRKQPV